MIAGDGGKDIVEICEGTVKIEMDRTLASSEKEMGKVEFQKQIRVGEKFRKRKARIDDRSQNV